MTRLRAVEARCRELEEDKAALDWLEAHWMDVKFTSPDMSNKNWRVRIYSHEEAPRHERHLTLRAALRAAKQSE